MKRNVLTLTLAFAGILSTNAFAYEIYKGKITSHKEWATGPAKGSFTANPSNKMKAKLNSSHSGFIQLYSYAAPAKTTVGTPAIIEGNSSAYFTNESNETKLYAYTLSVCSMLADKLESCLFSFDQISLEPGGYFMSDTSPTLQIAFDKAGSYGTYVQAFLAIDMGDSITMSTSSSTVEVS